MLQIVDAITTPFEDFELVVEPFHESAAGAIDKVIGDLFPPMLQGLQEGIEALQPALSSLLHPGPDFSFRHRLRRGMLKNGGQLLTQPVGLL